MDPYLRNKDWLYGLGRKGCAPLVWLSAWAGLVVAASLPGLLRLGLLSAASRLAWLRRSGFGCCGHFRQKATTIELARTRGIRLAN